MYICERVEGLLAQLVQSAALTGQRSLVRIQYSSQRKSRVPGVDGFFHGIRPSLLELWDIKKTTSNSARCSRHIFGYKSRFF